MQAVGDTPRLNARWSREPGRGPRRRHPHDTINGTATRRPAHLPRPQPARTGLDLTLIGCSAEVGEEELDLAVGRLRRVGAVDDVVLHLEGEVTADGAGRGLYRVGGAGQRAERLDRPWALDHQRHQRATGDELDQGAEERPLAVLGVVGLGDIAGQRAQFGGNQPQILALEPGDHLADQATGDAVGLDEDQSAFSHGAAAYGVPGAAPSPSPGSRSGSGVGTAANGDPSRSLRICSRYSQMSTNAPPRNHITPFSRPVSSTGNCNTVPMRRPCGRRCTPLARMSSTASARSIVSRGPVRPGPLCAMPRGTKSTVIPSRRSTPAAAPRSARPAPTGSAAVTSSARSAGCGPPPP